MLIKCSGISTRHSSYKRVVHENGYWLPLAINIFFQAVTAFMEIEMRAFAKNLAEVENKLKKLGAKESGQELIVDRWFCLKHCNHFDHVKQDAPGSYGLRVRQHGNSAEGELNIKVLEKQGDHSAFHEHEVRVSDWRQAQKILECAGFKAFC
jgi:adenylate cyclase class IV